MADRYIDFDAARAERRAEPITLRAFGEEFALPGALPASVMLDIIRMQAERGDDAEVTTQEALGLLERMVPDDVLANLLARPEFSTDDFGDLVRLVMSAYSGNGQGEAAAPSRAQRRSRGSQESSPARPRKTASHGNRSSSTGT